MPLTVKLLSPSEQDIELTQLPVYAHSSYTLRAFDDRTVEFFDAFSKSILADNEINRLPEIAALAFWLRKGNISVLKNENAHLFSSKIYSVSPIGKVFHICPANVDTMFMYSMAVSLLMGNKNVLRVSNRMNAPQIKKLFTHFNHLFDREQYNLFRDYINIITYEHNADISGYICQHSNARVIWGGDNTIQTFKNIASAPRTKDIVFADRVSILIIDSKTYLNTPISEIPAFAKKFFNDAYTFDQKGCSSPQNIYLVGTDDECKACLQRLCTDLEEYIKQNYDTDIASIASLKLNRVVDDVMDNIIDKRFGNNYLSFVHAKDISKSALEHSCGAGYFYVSYIATVNDLQPTITPKLQTTSYYGLDNNQLNQLKELSKGEGIDRIVPLGNALDFYYIWDGYNLFEELSRKVYIK